MGNSVNQTTPGLFSVMDQPVKKSLPPQPSETFDTAMKKAQPQPSQSSQDSAIFAKDLAIGFQVGRKKNFQADQGKTYNQENRSGRQGG